MSTFEKGILFIKKKKSTIYILDSCASLSLTKHVDEKQVVYAQFNQCCKLQGKIKSGILAGHHSSIGKKKRRSKDSPRLMCDSCTVKNFSPAYLLP